jgi:PPOX class probable F420-dependent enzyme
VPTWSELPGWALELIDTTPVAHLALLDESGHPRVQPITFVRVGDALWSAIDDKPKRRTPARIRRLRADPRATITVDRYDDDWARLAWVQVIGTMDVLAVDGREPVIRALQDRYPVYRTMSPKGPLLRLAPKRVLWWRASD